MKSLDTATIRGQALVYVIALIVPLALGIAYVYNAFNLANEKTRLQNTTDAVAYSVATIEARDLNFKSYTNRAMVANQVAIAQTVGLVSWTRWIGRVVENLSLVTAWIPYVNAVTRVLDRALDVAERVVETVMPGVASGIDAVVSALAASQRAMHVATVFVAGDTAREVIRTNDPDVDASISFANAALFADYTRRHNNFTRRFRPDTVRTVNRGSETYREHFERVEEFREITMESRDGFSTRRTYTWFRLPLFPIQFEMRRAGGTDLTGQNRRHLYGSWLAMDTMSWHTRTWRCGFSGCGWSSWRESIPIGWGAAKNSRQQENVSFRAWHNRRSPAVGNSWQRNGRASNLADLSYRGAPEVQLRGLPYRGLRSYYDLHYDGLIQKAPGITILLTKPQNTIRDANRIGYNNGQMNMDNNADMARNRMAAMAEAVPYFARINDNGPGTGRYRRSDRYREYGNLFNPYWQARLEPMSESEKRRVQVIAGVL